MKVTTQLRPWHCASCCEDRRQRSMAVGRPCSRNRSRGRARNTRTRIRRWEGIWSATGCCLHLPEKETLESWKTCQHTTAKKQPFSSPLSCHLLTMRRISRCTCFFNQKNQRFEPPKTFDAMFTKNLGPASSLQRSSAPAPVMGVLAGVRPDKVLSWLPKPGRPWRCGSVVEGKNRWSMFGPCFIELDDGKIYRKALYLMVKTMVSCRFSLNSIQWMFGFIPIQVSSKQFRPYLFGKPNSNGCHGIFHTETSILNHTNASTNDNTIAIRPCVGHDLAITQGQRQTEGFWREMQIEVAPYTCCASACDGFLGNANFQGENR